MNHKDTDQTANARNLRVATGQGKVGEIFIFLQGQGKVGEFCKLVREILNTKKVREFRNFGPKYVL